MRYVSKACEIIDLIFWLAKEYGIVFCITGKSTIMRVQSKGLPCNDYDLVDSFLLDLVIKSALYAQMLKDLPAGLSEWAVHPGFDNSELLAMEPDGNRVCQADYDFWSSEHAKDIVKPEEVIILVYYRPICEAWKGK